MFNRSSLACTSLSSNAARRRQCRLMLMSRLQEHLQRLKRATSLVDQRPPRLRARFESLSQDARLFLQRTNENVQLLLNLSRIKRTHSAAGPTCDQFRVFRSALPLMMRRLDELQRRNDILGRRLMSIHGRQRQSDNCPLAAIRTGPGSQLSTTSGVQQQQQQHSQLNNSRSDTSKAFAKSAAWNLALPSDRVELIRLMRPRIVLYFGLMDGRPLGQVVVQLYTEAAPLVVLQFIRTCLRQRAHEFAVRRIFPNLWLEGYLLGCSGQRKRSVVPPSQLSNPMDFDTRVVSHDLNNCVLSCAKEYCVHGFPGGAINFSISFKPLAVASGQRVGFGRVVRGYKVIEYMQSYGTKNGKISRPLVITHCNVL